jgi:hypothetical protein
VTTSTSNAALWPADVIHVNEDGWVLINRGSRHGVSVGLHLLVVGTGARELHDLFAPDASTETQPPVLRIRRTYEMLEVVYAEESCAIAIATRTPASRRPTVYRGPEGELLVWVPLPEGYTWPPPNSSTSQQSQPLNTPAPPWVAEDRGESDAEDAADTSDEPDAPPERAPQDDEPWEEALPLNSVSVGDIVLPAIPASPATSAAVPAAAIPTSSPSDSATTNASAESTTDTSLAQGPSYDWLKKPGQ